MTRAFGLPVAALALMAASPEKAAKKWIGIYDGSQTELAAALELRTDGGFGFILNYGALDEVAEGRWALEGDRIVLTVVQHESNDPEDAGFGESTLTIDGNALTLPRHGRLLRFVKR